MSLVAKVVLAVSAICLTSACVADEQVWVPVIDSNGDVIWVPGIKKDDGTVWIQLNAHPYCTDRGGRDTESRAPEKDGNDSSLQRKPSKDKGFGKDKDWTEDPSDYDNRRFVPDRDR